MTEAQFLVVLALGYQRALDFGSAYEGSIDQLVKPKLDKAMRLRSWEWFSRAQAAGIVLQ